MSRRATPCSIHCRDLLQSNLAMVSSMETQILVMLDQAMLDAVDKVVALSGGELDRASVIAFAAERGLSALEMEIVSTFAENIGSCPACGCADMQVGSVGNIRVQACIGCAGVWLDNASAQRLVARLDTAVAEAVRAHETAVLGAPAVLYTDPSHSMESFGTSVGPYRARSRTARGAPPSCPVCHAAMEQIAALVADVRLDICRAHGTFFDAGELPHLVETGLRRRAQQQAFEAASREHELDAELLQIQKIYSAGYGEGYSKGHTRGRWSR